jgi:hypothetical protein
MECPKCLKNWVCGCRSCKSRRNMPTYRSSKLSGGKVDWEQCPYCRTKYHPDQLLDYEWALRQGAEEITGDPLGVVSDIQLNEIRKKVRKSKLLKHLF